jgi:hypothetical protein
MLSVTDGPRRLVQNPYIGSCPQGSILIEATVPLEDLVPAQIEGVMSNTTGSLSATLVQNIAAVPGIENVTSGNISAGDITIKKHERPQGGNLSATLTNELDGFWRSSLGPLVQVTDGFSSFDGNCKFPILLTSEGITMMGLTAISWSFENVSWGSGFNDEVVFAVWTRLASSTTPTSTTSISSVTETSTSITSSVTSASDTSMTIPACTLAAGTSSGIRTSDRNASID